MIAVVVITHNRLERLERCVEHVLLRTSDSTSEIVIWDNASTDGTPAYLGSLRDPRIRCILNDTNIGQNGYARAFRSTSTPYLIEVDDDVIDAPRDWDRTLLDAYRALDDVGFLAADLVDDVTDKASFIRHHVRADQYGVEVVNGVRLLTGPAGGGCAMTSRAVMDEVGGFPEKPEEVFFLEDQEYILRLDEHGYRPAVLADLRVHHQGGPEHAYSSPEKSRYWEAYARRLARRNAVKRVLLRIPFVPRLNERFRWFYPPAPLLRDEDLGFAPKDSATGDRASA